MRIILVTGVSGGLGYEIVKNLLDGTEYRVVGMGRTAPLIPNSYSKRFEFLPCDMRNASAVSEVFKEQVASKGPVFGLVNNAADAYDDLVTNASFERLNDMFMVNVLSPMLLTKQVLRDMLLHETAGSIVNITSLAAHTGYKGLAMYGATKGAMESFSRGVAREYGARGIRSNCVSPGFMKTKMTEKLGVDQVEKIAKRTSLKKLPTLEATANTVRFLLGDEANSITGTTIHVDSGSL